MQQIQTQQDKPMQQGELRTVVWQNGKGTLEGGKRCHRPSHSLLERMTVYQITPL